MVASMLRATSSESGISDGTIAKSVTLAGDIGGDRPCNFTGFLGCQFACHGEVAEVWNSIITTTAFKRR
jgi:hypothetical protein